MSIYLGIAASAFVNGLFTGILIKTGMDLSPAGIAKQFVDALEPFLPSSLDPQVEFVKFLIVAAPWIATVVTILIASHKILALTIYVIVFMIAVVFITDPTALFAQQYITL